MVGLLAAALLGTCTPYPAYETTLVGYEQRSPIDGRPFYSDRFLPRWRIDRWPAGPVELVYLGDKDVRVLTGKKKRLGEYTFVASPRPPAGRYRVELRVEGRTIGADLLEFRRSPAHHPRAAGLRAARAAGDREAVRREAHALLSDPDPWIRFVGHVLEARRHGETGPEAARTRWHMATQDPVLRAEMPSAVAYAWASVHYFDSQSDETLKRATVSLQAMRAEVDRAPTPCGELGYQLERARELVRLGQSVRALPYLQTYRAALEAEGEEERFLTIADEFIGLVLGMVGRPTAAVAQLERAVEDEHATVMGLHNLGWEKLRAVERGIEPWSDREVEADFEAHLQRPGLSVHQANASRASLAYLALRRGDEASAHAWLGQVTGWGEADFAWERPLALMVRADLDARAGRVEEARRTLERVASDARRVFGRATDTELRARHLLARVEASAGEPARAQAGLEQAWRVSKELTRQLDLAAAGQYLRLRQTLPIDVSRQRASSSEAVLNAAVVLEEALYERWAKARAISAGLRETPAYLRFVDSQEKLRVQLVRGCAHLPPDTRPVCEAETQTLRQSALTAQLAFYADLTAPELSDPEGALAAKQASLGDDEGLLLSWGDAEDMQAFLLTKEAVVTATGASPLGALTSRLRTLGRLEIAGPLDPSEALSPDGKAPWASRLVIVRRPSGTWRGTAVPSAGDPVVVADPAGDLPHSHQQGLALASRLGVPARLKTAATRASLIEPLRATPRPRLVVFSGHGEMVGPDASTTRLRLADGDLTVQDVLTHGLSAKLVVLNGCTTGGAATGYGVGLPEAFLLQGSDAVLATIRPVEDAAGRAFVDRFLAEKAERDPEAAFLAAVRWSRGTKAQAWRHYRLWRR